MWVDELENKSNRKGATQFALLSDSHKMFDIIIMLAKSLVSGEVFYLILLLLLIGFLFAVPLLTMIW